MDGWMRNEINGVLYLKTTTQRLQESLVFVHVAILDLDLDQIVY